MSQKPNASGRLSAVRCRGLRASLSDAWKIYVVNYKVFSLFLLPYLLLAGLGAALLSYIFMNVVCGYFLPASYLDLTASVSGMVVVFSSIKYSDWIQLFMSAITFGVAFYLLEGAAAVQLRFYKAIDSMPRQQKGFLCGVMPVGWPCVSLCMMSGRSFPGTLFACWPVIFVPAHHSGWYAFLSWCG